MAEKEYIEREAALKANCYFCSAHLEDDSPCVEKCADYMKFIEIPAADVRPVVRGKWIWKENGEVVCSTCNYLMAVVGNTEDFVTVKSYHNFCPNCGAMMEES